MLSEREKTEWLETAKSRVLREDMRYLSANRHNPFMKDGKVDLDKFIEFLNGYNEFINHRQKPFKPMADSAMKL